MIAASWPAPLPGGGAAPAYALTFDRDRAHRVLVVPALFDESNRLRRFTVELMRRLDAARIDSVLPDLPGCNESRQPLEAQTLTSWRDAAAAAALHFSATHVVAVRGGGLLVPLGLPGWRYAPVKGANLLRQMLRARVLAAREAGREESTDSLLETGLHDGLELAGYRLGAAMLGELRDAVPTPLPGVIEVAQDALGGAGLWLRAEPGESAEQADTLAALIVAGIAA